MVKEKPQGLIEIEETFKRMCKGETLEYIKEWFSRANITLIEYNAHSTDGKKAVCKQAQAYIKNDLLLFSFDNNGLCENVTIY